MYVAEIEEALGTDYCANYVKYIAYDACGRNQSLINSPDSALYNSSDWMKWGNARFNFDNMPMAMQSIFIISTLDMWPNIMYDAIDATGLDATGKKQAPKRNHQPWVSLYFVVIVVLAGFVSSNLIISVIVDNFNKIKLEKEGSAFLTRDQQNWMRTRRLTDKITLVRKKELPLNDMRKRVFFIVESPNFEPMVMICICLNCATMMMEHYNMEYEWINTLQIIDIFFIIVFTMEAKMKIFAYGWVRYWAEVWNKFDFIIVAVSLVGLMAQAGVGLNFIRVFRIGRVLRLINKAQSLRTMFLTLWYAVPAFWNIGLLMSVIFFMYAVFGMEWFGDIAWNEYITRNANFTNFPTALTLLWRLATGDQWADAYTGCTFQPPNCPKNVTSLNDVSLNGNIECGDPASAALYFLSFNVFGSLVLINLFIAVILDMFTQGVESQKQEKHLKSVQIWKSLWEDLDQNRNGELDVMNFIHTLLRAPKPAGLSTLERAIQLREVHLRGGRRLTIRNLNGRVPLSDDADILGPPAFEDVITHFEQIKLLVHKKRGSNGHPDSWYVVYEECVIALGTMIVGPKIEAPVKDAEMEMSFIDWYMEEFQVKFPDK